MSSTREYFFLGRALFALPFVVLGCAPDTVPSGATGAATPAVAFGEATPGAPLAAAPPQGAAGAESAAVPPTAAVAAAEPMDATPAYTNSVYAPIPIANRVSWPNGVPGAVASNQLGSIVGDGFYDSGTGEPIVNMTVSTRAKCTGSGCNTLKDGTNSAELRMGKFVFDAYAAKPVQLELEGDSAFAVGGKGYNTLTIAHGPWGTVDEGGKRITRFQKVYMCLASAPDEDQDGICDSAEARYGTNPKSKDTDKDGISDWIEIYGKKVSDGYALDVRGLGANPTRYDIFVEVDSMATRAPQPEAIAAVIAAFKRAPVIDDADPNKGSGIDLHVFLDEVLDATETSTINFDTLGEVTKIREAHLKLKVDLPFHYALFGTTMYRIIGGEQVAIGSSGRTDAIPGSMFAVTLGTWASDPFSVAATFMHELGHNLGLKHGGQDHDNWKPNYFSLMNYLYQMAGVPYANATDQYLKLDYSRGRFSELIEVALDETKGFVQENETFGPNDLRLVHQKQYYTNPRVCVMQTDEGLNCKVYYYGANVPGPVDFDGDGKILASAKMDINGSGDPDIIPATPSDWSKLQLTTASIGKARFVEQITPCPAPRDPTDATELPNTGAEPGSMPTDPSDPTGATQPGVPGDTTLPTKTERRGGAVHLPAETGGFDYQLAARYPADARVGIISSNAGIAADGSFVGERSLDKARYNICYLNALQTQPSDYNYWMSTHPDLILLDAAGQPVHDPDPEWQGEMLFDISTADKRMRLLAVQSVWLSRCREAGFQAVEPDNLDSYTRSQGALSADAAQSYMQLFVAEAHAFGLAVAQKNAANWVSEQGSDGMVRAASVGFDFAIIEECQLTGECDVVTSYYGAGRVFEIEYVYDTVDSSSGVSVAANSNEHFVQACAARGSSVRIVLRNRDVRAAGEPGYVFELCGDMPTPGEVDGTEETMTPGMPGTEPRDSEPGVPNTDPQDNDPGFPQTEPQPGSYPGDGSDPTPPQDPTPGDETDPTPTPGDDTDQQPQQDPYPPSDPQDPYPPSDPQDPYPPSDPQDPSPPSDPQDPYPPSDPQDPYPPSEPQDPPQQEPGQDNDEQEP